jgi:hypothetical protein
MRIWSEVRGARLREQAADLATLLWIALWGTIGWQVYEAVAAFSEAGRLVRAGGEGLVGAGRDLGAALSGIPLVGPGLQDVARNAFAGAGLPLEDFGSGLEEFVLLIATILTLLLALVVLVPWLTRYIPWRWERLQRTRAGARAIRDVTDLPAPRLAELLALRAVTRLDYRSLLEFSPDPLGDWASGRHDRLARAELASVGLRPVGLRRKSRD